MPSKWTRFFGVSALVALIAALFVATPADAYTLDSADFDASYIISDAQFFDDNALTEAQIQAFLNLKIGTCGNSRCLNVYKMDTFDRAASVIDTSSNAPLCLAYAGAAAEPAARIIYKVQKACHISAKVILTTLQKEQGLVTATSPSKTKLKIAMGYGCPDTAPCDAQYFGFYNQVYKAASQMKRYTDTHSSYWNSKKVGTTVNIGYHPKSFADPPTCGKKSVYIGNKATHALYLYTPYTPNAAALANLWSTGDGCSSYGNRNFWRNYNAWFNLKEELYLRVAALPSATKTALGTVTSDAGCPDTTNNCIINYQTGVVSFAFMGSAVQVSFGSIGTAYKNSGGPSGPLGAIVGAQETISAGGTGYRQRFTNGYIYQAPNAATFVLMNDMNTFYAAQGGPAGSLGWPASATRCATTKCDQLFDNGLIITNSSGQLSTVPGAIGEALYSAGGVNAAWGLPTGSRATVTSTSGNGAKQTFQNGVAFERTDTAAFVSASLIPALTAVGGQDVVGWPSGTTQSSGTNRYQTFTNGTLFGSTANATGILLPTAMATVWTATGGASSYLGVPNSAASAITNSTSQSGSVVTFTGGAIISSPLGVFAQPASIRTKYLAAGGSSGALGFPIAAPTKSNTTWTQRFQGGTLTSAAAVTRPTIQLGSRGADVKYLQKKLGLTADGIFGNQTRKAVIKFQKAHGLTADGIVGPRTWAALG